VYGGTEDVLCKLRTATLSQSRYLARPMLQPAPSSIAGADRGIHQLEPSPDRIGCCVGVTVSVLTVGQSPYRGMKVPRHEACTVLLRFQRRDALRDTLSNFGF
jgi:hypothetical protein